jgi:chromate reductase
MSQTRPRILILNASLAGAAGNTAAALEILRAALVRGKKVEVREVTLVGDDGGESGSRDAASEKRVKGFAEVRVELARADAFVFGTGTHWDSWSSVLQRFLEDATATEGTQLWLGKPAACVVTEHSVGGKGVLSRLQGVLVTLGCAVPPMSGVVLSKAAQMAGVGKAAGGGLPHGGGRGARGVHSLALVATGAEDFWGVDDLKIVAHNLVEAANGTRRWKAWPVDREDFAKRWME